MKFSWTEILSSSPIPGFPDLTVSRILLDLTVIILIYVLARLAVWFIRKVLNRRLLYLKDIEEGKRFAIIQISKYIVYALAIAILFERLHIGSIIFTSFAGLFVGLGFGLQQTFNDLSSGLILLFEGSVKVGDIIDINETVGRVSNIGVRHSVIQTRNDEVLIVPNSKLIVDSVKNLSGNTNITRFHVRVGVAYGSELTLVKEKLLEAAGKHPEILRNIQESDQEYINSDLENPRVYFQDFGDNSLVFDLYFWTRDIWDVDIVKSDLRFEIDRLFREENITIAFPQRDIHFKIEDAEAKKMQKIFS